LFFQRGTAASGPRELHASNEKYLI